MKKIRFYQTVHSTSHLLLKGKWLESAFNWHVVRQKTSSLKSNLVKTKVPQAQECYEVTQRIKCTEVKEHVQPLAHMSGSQSCSKKEMGAWCGFNSAQVCGADMCSVWKSLIILASLLLFILQYLNASSLYKIHRKKNASCFDKCVRTEECRTARWVSQSRQRRYFVISPSLRYDCISSCKY